VTSDENRENVKNSERPQNFKDLLVWQKGMDIAKMTYELTFSFPKEERFGLVSQMRRAAVSIPSNIAEGQARHTTGEFVQFVSHAEGSLAELETQLRLAVELKFLSHEGSASLFHSLDEERKMLNALRRALTTRHSSLVTHH
jgi:four helix bundle protein